MLNTQQLIAAQQAQVESFFDLTHKAFSNMEKVVELNMATARATLSESADLAKAALSAKDPQSLMALQASLLQPGAEKATAYGRHLADIAKSAQADVVAVAEAQVAAVQQSLHHQERTRRHRERCGVREAGRGSRQQRLCQCAEGCQASHGHRRSQLQCRDGNGHEGRQGRWQDPQEGCLNFGLNR